jgi:recombination protein RecA
MPSKKGQVLDRTVAALQKKFGATSAIRLGEGRESRSTVREVLPTGIEVVDHYALGIGGLPVGRASEVCGEPGCGKSSFGYACAGSAQKVGAEVWFFDGEQQFDEDRATVMGVDLNGLHVATPENLEMGVEQTKMILELHDPKVGPLLIVWDTLASMLSKADMGREAGERGTAEQARIMSAEMPKLHATLALRRAHLLILNQTRSTIGVMFGPNTVTPGGNAVKFYTSWRAQFFGGKAVKDGEQHVAKVVTFLTAKTRFSPPFRKARVRLDYATGWNNEWSTLEHAKGLGHAPRGAKGRKAHAAAVVKLGWTIPVIATTDAAAGAQHRDEEE